MGVLKKLRGERERIRERWKGRQTQIERQIELEKENEREKKREDEKITAMTGQHTDTSNNKVNIVTTV